MLIIKDMKKYFINFLSIVATLLVSDIAWGANLTGGTMSGSIKLTDNTSLANPITVSGTLTIDLNGYVLFPNGGADFVIKVPAGAKLIIKDSNPTLEHAGYIDANGLFRWPQNSNTPQHAMPGGIIYNPYKNESTDRKGIAVEGTCEIQGGKIAGCFTKGIGAAITCSSSGTLKMTGGEILYNRSNNSSGVSGVIYGEATNNNSGSRINLSNVKLSHNKTAGRGGAICGYHVTLYNCTFLNNSSGMEGGAIYVRNSGTPGTLSIDKCTIQYNTSASTGGGIYVGDSTPCTISNSDLSYNYAAAFGGGIYSTGSTTIKNSKIKGNWAMSTETGLNDNGGGAVNLGRGGGFCFSGNGTTDESKAVLFVLDNTEVTENVSMYYGGGGQLQNGGKLTIQNNTKINKNTCVLKGAAGLHLTGGVFFYMKETTEISGNIALGGVGGGIHSSYECALHLDGGTISKNVVYGRGGGVHINTGGDIILNGTNITDNKAYDGFNLISSTVSKGADGKYTWSTPVGQQNYPMPGYGGGLLINSGSCTMNKGELSRNHAQSLGGGIGMIMTTSGQYAHHVRLASFTLNSGNVSGNTTDGNGGGIYLMENILQNLSSSEKDKYTYLVQSGDWTPKIILNGGTISNNVAAINGGGAYQEQKTAFIVSANKSTTLSGNKAGQSGGAVYIAKGNFTVNGTASIVSNQAETGDGGAIYLGEGNQSSPSVFTVGNKGRLVLGGDASTAGNLAGGNGGGVYCGGSFSVNGISAIIGNTATQNGGALYVTGTGASITLKDCTISKNRADVSGGAFYVEDGSIVMNGAATISENIALLCGGAAYVNNGSISTAEGNLKTTISNNKVDRNTADGSDVRYSGGAFFIKGESTNNKGSLNLRGETEIIGNSTYHNGGAIALDKGNVIITGAKTTMSENEALNGGAVFVFQGDFKAENANADIVVERNSVRGNGGAIYVTQGNFITDGKISFTQNSSKGSGGAVYVKDGQITVNNPTMKENVANSNKDGIDKNGGAVCVLTEETSTAGFTATGAVTLNSNAAKENGGAVYVAGGNIEIAGQSSVLTLTGNSAENGGAFYVNNGNINAGQISSAAITNNYSTADGGAFYLNRGNITLCDTELSGNGKVGDEVKTVNGGAIALHNGIFTFGNNSEIKNNAASGYGGGLYVTNDNTTNITCQGGSYLSNKAGIGGGIYASGDNKARDGGGLYLDNGVELSFGNGLIVGNSAEKTGGGIYLSKGKLTFTATEDLGIYNNAASVEAADIYSSGSGTTVNLPDVTGMNLIGFEVPGSDLYWVKDFEERRYETALRNNEDIGEMILPFGGNKTLVLTNEQCLDLGYDLVFVTLVPVGLDPADNASLTISYPHKTTGEPIEYRKVVLAGTKSQKVGLPSNHWQLCATPWSFTYDNDEVYNPVHSNTTDANQNLLKDYIYIKRNHNQTITITFSQTEAKKKLSTYDAIKVNIMRPGGSM